MYVYIYIYIWYKSGINQMPKQKCKRPVKCF